MKKRFYSTIEAAKILRISRIATFKQVKSGKIKATRVGKNYIIAHKDLTEALGQVVGPQNKQKIHRAVNKAIKHYRETFKLLGKE